MKFRHWWQETSLALLAVIAVTVSTLLILSSLRLHMAEMKWQLQKSEFLDGNMSKMFLLARFVDQYKLFQETVDRRTLDEREFQLNLLFDTRNSSAWKGMEIHNVIDFVSIQFVNGLRLVTQKAPLANLDEVRSLELLEQAFQLERIREYRDALGIYELLEVQVRDVRLQGIIRLHRGFCQALLGEVDLARASYERVIESHRDDDLGVTATLLLRHLETILQERVALLRSDIDQVTKARKMAALLQCKDVLESFDPDAIQNNEARTEVLMLRARCEEELGNKNSALEQYVRVIRTAGETEVARDANRRVFLLGSQTAQGERIREAAVRVNRRLQDPSFKRMQEWESAAPRVEMDPRELEEEPSPEIMVSLEETAKAFGLDSAPSTTTAPHQALQQTKVKTAVEAPRIMVPPSGTTVRVEMEGGKTFVGQVISEPGAEEIEIQTMIGVIGVSRKELVSITAQE